MNVYACMFCGELNLQPMRMHWDDHVRALDKDMNRYYT